MATTGSFNGNCTIALSDNTSRSEISWFRMNCEYNVDAVPGEQAYSVKVRVRLVSDYEMNYSSLKTKLNITVDDQSQSEIGAPEMSLSGYGSGGIGPWTDWFEYKYYVGEAKSTINISVMLDLSGITGIISGSSGGPDYESRPGYHFREFNASTSIDVSGIVIGRPPVLTSLENNNKYNNPATGVQNGVSASTNSLSIKANVSDWGDPTATLHWSCSGKSGTSSSATFNVTGLSAGTSYTVSVYLSNSIGSSETKTITIRTRYAAPVVNISLDSVDLEQLIFDWTSDKDLKSTEYKIDSGSWVQLGQTGRSGTFTAQWFDPKTAHTIHFRGTSTNALDALLSAEKSASGTTHDRAHITAIGECTFGLNISVTIKSESDKQLKVEIWTEGNSLTPRFTFDNIGIGDRTWTFAPTQDQLDKMYRCYPKANTIPIHFKVTTHGEWKDWQDSQQDKTLTLTGIAKTAHVGDSSNKPRRCQIWVGDSSNKPRRAVGWVGVNGQAHRTI